MAVTEQLEIAAGGHGETAFDEADDGIAQGRRLPWLGGDTRIAVDGDRDFAIGRAGHAGVEDAQHLARSTPALQGQALVRRNRAAAQHGREAAQRVKTIRGVVVEDDDGDQNAAGRGIDPDDFEALSGDAYPQVSGIGAVDDMRSDEFLSNARIA